MKSMVKLAVPASCSAERPCLGEHDLGKANDDGGAAGEDGGDDGGESVNPCWSMCVASRKKNYYETVIEGLDRL